MDLPLLALAATVAPAVGAVAAAVLGGRIGGTSRMVRFAAVLALGILALALGGPGGAAAAGLFLGGAAVAGPRPAAALTRATALLLFAAGLDAAPRGWDLFPNAAPFPPAATARLLDASPRVLVMEAAGADWVRHPSLYGPAGTDRIGPSVRSPYRPVAGRWVLLVGCLLLLARLPSPSGAPPDPLP
ncbi:MAG: hypothetical protein AAFU73_10045 [Planctomycetota bacterium]